MSEGRNNLPWYAQKDGEVGVEGTPDLTWEMSPVKAYVEKSRRNPIPVNKYLIRMSQEKIDHYKVEYGIDLSVRVGRGQFEFY